VGHVIQLPFLSATYPEIISSLESAERTFVLGIRDWLDSYRQGNDPLTRLCEMMQSVGAHDAAFSIDALMAVIARTTRRSIAINYQRCPYLSADEKHLLYAASLAQAGESELAERVLRTTLLSAHGAEFALGPLEGLGELFAEVRLFFGRRKAAAADAPETGGGGSLATFRSSPTAALRR
jgi:hypothetical protein